MHLMSTDVNRSVGNTLVSDLWWKFPEKRPCTSFTSPLWRNPFPEFRHTETEPFHDCDSIGPDRPCRK